MKKIKIKKKKSFLVENQKETNIMTTCIRIPTQNFIVTPSNGRIQDPCLLTVIDRSVLSAALLAANTDGWTDTILADYNSGNAAGVGSDLATLLTVINGSGAISNGTAVASELKSVFATDAAYSSGSVPETIANWTDDHYREALYKLSEQPSGTDPTTPVKYFIITFAIGDELRARVWISTEYDPTVTCVACDTPVTPCGPTPCPLYDDSDDDCSDSTDCKYYPKICDVTPWTLSS